jgi:hypothetical protein
VANQQLVRFSSGFTQLLFLEMRSLKAAVKGDRDVPVGPASHVPRCCNPLPFSYLIKNQKEKRALFAMHNFESGSTAVSNTPTKQYSPSK